MAASAVLLRAEGPRHEGGSGFQGPIPTQADLALAPYRQLRDEVVGAYATRFRVPHRLAGIIHETAVQERIDPDLAFRLVRTESAFRQRAVGPAGAVGLAQVKPSTARWLDTTVTRERLFEAETNLRLGFRYLRMLLRMYDHDTRLALLAYNRGPGTVAALLSIGEDPGNGYAGRVLGTRRQVRQIVVAPPAALAGGAEPREEAIMASAGAEDADGRPAPEDGGD